MKKTLVALMALAGIAAASVDSWDLQVITSAGTADKHASGNADFWFKGDSESLTSYMFDFTVDTVGGLDRFFATVRGDVDGASRTGLMIDTWDVSAAAGIYFNEAHVTTGGSNNIGPVSAGDTFRFAYDSQSDMAYLYSVKSEKLLSVTLSGHTGYSDELCYFTSGVKGTTATVGSSAAYANGTSTQVTYGTIYDMSSLAGNNVAFSSYVKTLRVPEPATATLSLLALCGLAARRRRK